jgi:hypothetical protein
MKLPGLDYLEEDTDGCRQALERAEETARIPSLNRRYAAWHGEGSAASADEDAVFTFFNLTPSSCAEAPSQPNATGTPMHGVGRAATLKNATQRTVEAHTQEINMIAMRIDAAFGVPCINTRH